MKQRRTIATLPVKGSEEKKVEVALYYSLGGTNFFTGNCEPRGLYLAVTPIEESKHDGYVCRTVTAFSGTKRCVKTMSRFSEKVLKSYNPSGEEIEPLLRYVLAKNNIILEGVM